MLLVAVFSVMVVLFWFGHLRHPLNRQRDRWVVLTFALIGCATGLAQSLRSPTQRPLAIAMTAASAFLAFMVVLLMLDDRDLRRERALRSKPRPLTNLQSVPKIRKLY